MSIFDPRGPFLFCNNEVEKSEEEAQQEEEKIQEQLCELMYMQQQYHGVIMEQRYALRDSKLCCQYGTRYARLDCIEDNGILKRRFPLLTVLDCTIENIHSFGSCLCPEANYAGRLPMTVASSSREGIAVQADCNIFPHICVPLIGSADQWKQIDGDLLVETNAQGYVPMLTDNAVLVCQYGGIISICDVPQVDESDKSQLITMKQMNDFGFKISEEDLEKLNRLLEENGVIDRVSIALFMATCGHESGMGTLVLEEEPDGGFDGYDIYTRGAGYIQVTANDQLAFYEYMGIGKDEIPSDRATDIADNYAWEASVWEWAICKKGDGVIMNEYVTKYGSSEGIFLITQYFINSYLSKEHYPAFNDDLREIRENENVENKNSNLWSYDLEKKWVDYKGKEFTGVLYINGRTYRLPLNYGDRKEKYENALKYFLQ